MVAPHFERLATQHSVPKKVAFCKVNVDMQSSISRAHGVSAMPTFIIFHCGKAVNTIKGADPSALSAAISAAVKLKDQGTPGQYFKTEGRTLGGNTVAGGGLDFSSILNSIVLFVGLYVVSMFSARALDWLSGKVRG
jgi:thioredoxin 1